MSSETKFVTRKTGVELANETGIPLTVGGVNKDAMNGRGPKPFGKLGPAEIYTVEEFMRYAVDRVRAPEVVE